MSDNVRDSLSHLIDQMVLNKVEMESCSIDEALGEVANELEHLTMEIFKRGA